MCSCSQLFEVSKFKHIRFPHIPWLCPDLQIGHRKLVEWSWLYLQGTTSCTQVSIPWSMYWFVRGSCAFAPKAHYYIVVRLFFLSWTSIHSLDCHLIMNCMVWSFRIVDYVRYTLLSSPSAPVCYRLNLHLKSFCWLWPVGEISHPCKIWGADFGLGFLI